MKLLSLLRQKWRAFRKLILIAWAGILFDLQKLVIRHLKNLKSSVALITFSILRGFLYILSRVGEKIQNLLNN